jgi:ABC-type lipoprotein release transport system permease subunit
MSAAGSTTVVQRVWGYGNIGNTLIVVVGLDLQNPYVNQQAVYPVESGVFLDSRTNGTVVLGKAVANLLNAKVGSILTILSASNKVFQYTVAGIFDSESSIYNADMIVMSINDARQFFNVPTDKATDLLIYINGVDDTTKVSLVNYIARDLSVLPDVRVVTKDILLSAQETTFGNRSGYFAVVWFVILIAVAIVAFHQTVVVGNESKFEIGLLKSLGFSTSDVIKVRIIEGLVLGTLAAAAGIVFGVVYDVVLGAPVLKDFMLGWANLYPGFPVPVYVSAETVGFVFAITMLPLLFATVIPSWLNATVDPDIAMRGAKA